MLYDAVNVLIWCNDNNCKHRLGYRFHEYYYVPLNIETPTIESDKHNSISSAIKFVNQSFIWKCGGCNSYLKSNEGIVSSNGRFKLLLESSGNLIIKDNNRTMWESLSGDRYYSEGPYELILNDDGDLQIIDSNKLVIWYTIHSSSETCDETNGIEFRMELQDTGNLVVSLLHTKTSTEEKIWESLPLKRIPDSRVIVNFDESKDFKTNCEISDNNTKRQMKSNAITINILPDGSKLESENGKHVLEIKNEKLFLDNKILKQNVSQMTLEHNGDLIILAKGILVWKTNTQGFDNVYKVNLSNSGAVNIYRRDVQIYSEFWNSTTFVTEFDDPKNLKLIVPLYFYPVFNCVYWGKIANAAKSIDVFAIVNVNEGPGTDEPNGNYIKAITKLKDHGVKILGYVSVSYFKRVN